jgi:hypothetical protein
MPTVADGRQRHEGGAADDLGWKRGGYRFRPPRSITGRRR